MAVLNIIEVTGKVNLLHKRFFMIEQNQPTTDEFGDIGVVVNQFKILTPHGRKYSLTLGEQVKIQGSLRMNAEDGMNAVIMPDHIKRIKK